MPDPLHQAFHEAGHFVIAYFAHRPVARIGVTEGRTYRDPRVEELAHAAFRPLGGAWVDPRERSEAESEASVYAGGVAAELIHLRQEPEEGKEPDASLHPDWRIVKAVVGRCVPKGANGEHFHLRIAIYRRAAHVLRWRWTAVTRLAERLLTVDHLAWEEAVHLFERSLADATPPQKPAEPATLAAALASMWALMLPAASTVDGMNP